MGFISKYRFCISLIDDSIFLCLLVNHIHLTAIIFGEFLKFGNILNIKNLLKVTLMLSMFVTSATKSFAADNFEKLFIGIMGAAIGSAAQKSAQQKQVGNTSQLTQQSNLVRRSQIALKTLGFYTSSVDGKLGTNTNSAAQLYVNKYKIQNFSFGEIKDVLRLEQIAEQSVTIVTHSPPKPVPIEKAGFFGPNKATLSIGSYKSLGEVGLTITEFYQKNKLALNDVQFSIFSTNSGYYVVTLGVGSTQKCERVRSLGVRRKVIPSDSYCSLGDGFKDSYIFKGGEIRASNNWYALNLISVGLPPVNYDSESDDVQTAGNTLVFATLKKDTQKILMELKEFVSEGGRFVNPSKISKTVYNLEQNIQKKELENIARYFKELQLLLNNENSFSEYQEKLLLIAKESKARAVSSALSKLEKYNAFISDFVSKKPFDKKSTVLIGMGEDIAKALKDNDMDGIIDIFDGISKKLSALNLYKEAEKFKIIIAEDVGTTVAGALEKEALLAEANIILSWIKSYNDEGGKFKDKRAVSRSFANLNKAISKQEDLVSAIAAIKEVYSTDEDFKNFKDQKIKATNVAEAEALKEATERVSNLKSFILKIVDEKPLWDGVGLLYETDDKAADILSRGDRLSILNFYSEAMVTLKSLGLDQDYTSYLKRVSLEAKSGDVAATQAKALKDAADLEAKALKDSADLEAKTLEKEALLAEANVIISSIKSYNDEGGEFKDKRAIGRGFANLNKAISKQEDLVSAIEAIKEVYSTDEDFKNFKDRKIKAANVAEAEALKEATERVSNLKNFILQTVDENPLSDRVGLLYETDDKAADILSRGDRSSILNFYSEAMVTLKSLGLDQDYTSYLKRVSLEAKSGDVAATQAKALKDSADLEAKTLEKEALLAEANVIISSIKSYNDEGGEFKDKRAIGRGFANLNKAISKQEDLVSAIEAIKEVYSTDEDFKNFKDRKIKAANVAEAEALKEATDRVSNLKNFILQTVDENPLSDRVGLLYETDDKAADILSRGDRSSILNFYSEAMVTLKSLGLDQDYTSYLKRVSLEAKSGDVAAIVADDQQKRLKRENLNQRGSTLMADVKKYIKEGQTFKFAVELARGVAALNSAQGRDSNEDELLEAIKILEHSVKNDIKFQEFRELEIQLRAAKDNDSVTLASDEVELVKNFIVSEISSDPLRKDLADLIEVLDIVKNAILEGKSSILLLAIDESMQKFGDLKLRKKFNRYKNETEIEKSLKGVKTVKNGLAITALNSDILSGDKRDIIALENRSGSAPNILRDLSGSVVFSNNTASVCWAGKPVNKNFSTRFVLKTLKELGVRNVKSFERCAKTEFDKVDIVLVHRGTFLIQKADYASKLIEKFESEQLSVFDTWFGEDTEEKIKIERSRGQKYLREVKAELLKGYGFILLENESPNLCMIIEEAEDQKLHNRYLDAEIEEIGLWVPDIKNRVSTNIEKSFAMAQKEMCKIIYAEAKDLKVITGGLEREKIPFVLSGLWATEDALSNLSSDIAEEKDGFERDLAKIRQDFEAQRVLKETIEAELAKKTNKIQKELRKKYSQEANAASNKVKTYLEAVFNPEKFTKRNSQEQLLKTKMNFNRTFSEISRWWRIKEISLWEAKNHSFEIFDYGTAEWKGRRLETITGTLNIEIQNPVLGQKDNKCVLLSIMIDDEFGYFRDSDEAKCSNSSSISVWQKARNFESRWVAN